MSEHRSGGDDIHRPAPAISRLDRGVVVLSLGSGQALPRLEQGDVDMGLMFSYAPTNPTQGNFWPTSAYAIDPANEEGNVVAKELLGRDRALRLNPAVLDIPTVTAAVMSRNPFLKEWISEEIRRNAEGPASTYAIENTDAFLRWTGGWDCERATDYAGWTPPRQLSDRASTCAPSIAMVDGSHIYMAWRGFEGSADFAGPQRSEEAEATNLWVSHADHYDAL